MKHTCITALLAAALLFSAVGVRAACPSVATDQRFEFTNGGAEVKDMRTGLVWARCSVGQSWDGSTCAGIESYFTHEAALQHAAGKSGWRLPNVKELASLADRGCIGLAIDSAAFPATPSYGHWSSSPYAGASYYAWVVYFGNGYVDGYLRYGNNAVRLVRASQ